MVHVRLNERETNPNAHVNFITALTTVDPAAQEDARQLLRALAAQVRPVMKAHGFVVNSLEEYEHNKVFAGRNWNNGEVIELVLRGASGTFLPVSWLMMTRRDDGLRKLAHIQHMNHGPAFQTLWTKLRREVRELQDKGYYGDGWFANTLCEYTIMMLVAGYWSAGARLADSARMGGRTFDPGDLPEYMPIYLKCGGAQSRTRPTSLRRRRNHSQAGPSSHTGAQTTKKRKAGSRVTAQGTFKGPGKALNGDISDQEQRKAGAGFRKKAGSKRAREERAVAAERRLKALQSQANTSTPATHNQPQDDSENESDVEILHETDNDRRRAMLDAMEQADIDSLKISGTEFSSEFVFPSTSAPLQPHDPEEQNYPICDVQVLPRASGVGAAGLSTLPNSNNNLGDVSELAGSSGNGFGKTKNMPYGTLVEDEIQFRKKESLVQERHSAGTGQGL
ncbi:uncharacterized protein FIBRA_02125 [Fibroporia radiculosa]|uniref:WLM domain-containing protein n=1 Tax=Fibroporia radiculosa TaxID=599839 RepID=J4G1D2_9APHY|nr:uncharacterized protein FIBRA_02125 [Fibroporia radiculosa]CCM00098.1 predicted protein [Fibroporia radiculosa]